MTMTTDEALASMTLHDQLVRLICEGRWDEVMKRYPGPKVMAEMLLQPDCRIEPLESAAMQALADAKALGRRAWLLHKCDEAAWEDAGAPPIGGQFALCSVHSTPVEAAARLRWLLQGQVIWLFDEDGDLNEEEEHNALEVFTEGQDPAVWLENLFPDNIDSIDATGGAVTVYAI
jgi:hypothetical protein